jgi:flagellar protein FlgJ
MGVESIGAFYLDHTRLMPPAPGGGSGGGGFAAILEERLAAAAPTEPPPEGGPPLAARDLRPVVDKTGKLYEQCEALETFLMKTILTGMRNTVPKTELLDGGFAGEIYEDMLYDEYAKDLTTYGGFGLAELAYLELTGQRGTLL